MGSTREPDQVERVRELQRSLSLDGNAKRGVSEREYDERDLRLAEDLACRAARRHHRGAEQPR